MVRDLTCWFRVFFGEAKASVDAHFFSVIVLWYRLVVFVVTSLLFGSSDAYAGPDLTLYSNQEEITAILVVDDTVWVGTNAGVVTLLTDGTEVHTYAGASGPRGSAVRDRGMALDSSGNVWVSCWNAGLSRFDRSVWTSYDTTYGLHTNRIDVVVTDTSGTVWAGGSGGLVRFVGETWELIDSASAGVPIQGSIDALAVDRRNRIWVGKRYDLFRHDDSGWVEIQLTDMAGNGIAYIAEIGDTVWVAHSGGVSFVTDSGISRIDNSDIGLPSGVDVVFVRAVGDSRVWCPASDGSIAAFDGATWSVIQTPDSTHDYPRVKCAAAGTGDAVWCGMSTGKLFRAQFSEWTTVYSGRQVIPENEVNALVVDADDNVWIGTAHRGIGRYDGAKWETYDTANSGIPSNRVYALAAAQDDVLWIGSSCGLAAYDGHQWQVFDSSNGLPGNRVKACAIQPDGSVWCTVSGHGIAVLRNNQWAVHDTNNGLPANNVEALGVGPDSSVWAGFYRSLMRYRDGTWTAVTPPIYTAYYFTAIAFDTLGTGWFGNFPVLTLDGETWDSQQVAQEDIAQIAVDDSNYVWLAEELGLRVFDGTDWTSITAVDGLPDEGATAIDFDFQGNAWVGTWNGVCRIDRSSVRLNAHQPEPRARVLAHKPRITTAVTGATVRLTMDGTSGKCGVAVYALDGKIVGRTVMRDGRAVLDAAELPSGRYVLRLRPGTHAATLGAFVLAR